MEYYKILYTKSGNNKVLTWEISVYATTNGARVSTMYGELNGNKAETVTKITEGKNIGKSNETTPVMQAVAEAKSAVTKKINQGYREDIEDLNDTRQDANNNDKPMLAQKFVHGKFNYPAIIQPKLNGVRAELGMRIKLDGLFGNYEEVYIISREGKEYQVPAGIKKDYLDFVAKNKYFRDTKWDGEIYLHGTHLQDIVSAIKKPNKLTDDLEFWCYDIKSDESQITRSATIIKLMSGYRYITVVTTDTVDNDNNANKLADRFILLGFEGAILRDMHAPYQYGKRTKYLQKIKRHHDSEFLLVDVIDSGKDNYNGKPIGMFVCKNDLTDATFKVTPEASKKERCDYLNYKNQYIGKNITVRYRERTKDQLPFHANGIIRDYE
jgi:DNA ligase-1